MAVSVPSGLGSSLLVGGILLLAGGGLAAAFVPAVECPSLSRTIERTMEASPTSNLEGIRLCRTRGHRNHPCDLCHQTCKVPILRRWMARRP